MVVDLSMQRQSAQSGLKYRFAIHLLKVSRIPTLAPQLDEVREKVASNRGKNTLKITALYNNRQQEVGEFQVINNGCIIDQKLICFFTCFKPEVQSKLHFYIDQSSSSDLTGHVAVDLKEFIKERDVEVHLKYPLYSNTSHHNRVPMLKMGVQCVGMDFVDTSSYQDFDNLVLEWRSCQTSSNERAQDIPVLSCEVQESDSYNAVPVRNASAKRRASLQNVVEDRLLKLEGALSELDSKLKTLASTYRTDDSTSNGNLTSDGDQTASRPRNLHVSSAIASGLSFNEHQELGENLECCDSVMYDYGERPYSSFGTARAQYSASKHSRISSDIASIASRLQFSDVVSHKRNLSTDQVFSNHWYPQSNSESMEAYAQRECSDCFVCTSVRSSYEGIYSGPSRNSSYSSLATSLHVRDDAASKRQDEVKPPRSNKNPGFFRSLFGAVVVAGVSILGARTASLSKKEKPDTADWSKVSRAAVLSHSEGIPRSGILNRRHYLSRSLI